MEETTENGSGRQNTETNFVQNPYSYIQVAIKNLLKCLGFESKNSSTSEEKDEKGVDETRGQELQADELNTEQPADPPAEPPADPPADPTSSIVSARATDGRTPARPPISGGRGGQTN